MKRMGDETVALALEKEGYCTLSNKKARLTIRGYILEGGARTSTCLVQSVPG
jgi:hypothetical protein